LSGEIIEVGTSKKRHDFLPKRDMYKGGISFARNYYTTFQIGYIIHTYARGHPGYFL